MERCVGAEIRVRAHRAAWLQSHTAMGWTLMSMKVHELSSTLHKFLVLLKFYRSVEKR